MLKNHMNNTHGQKDSQLTNNEEGKQSTTKPTIKCDECGFLTRSEDNVKEHKKKKHDKENVKVNDQQKEGNIVYMHSCISCIFQTNDYNSLKKHIEEIHMPLVTQNCVSIIPCTLCDKTFVDSTQLEKHMTEIHSTDTDQWLDSKCTKCGKIVRTNMGRERHVQLYCDSCRLCYPERTSFEIHMSVLHSEPIEQKKEGKEPDDAGTCCDQCGNLFENVKDLIAHIQMSHSNPELITCKHCDYKAPNKEEMYDHIECDHVDCHPGDQFSLFYLLLLRYP